LSWIGEGRKTSCLPASLEQRGCLEPMTYIWNRGGFYYTVLLRLINI
jgi:hypothetical protein